MRGFALGFIAACALLLVAPLAAENVVRVEPGKGGDLSARVLLLERAVAQLQGGHEIQAAIISPSFTCALKTPFDGTFSSSAALESTARSGAIAECKQHSKGSLYCEEKGLVCLKK